MSPVKKKKAAKKASKKTAKKTAKKPAKKPAKKAMMPTCGVSHNHCGGLCDRRQGHPDPEHHCALCGAWF